MEKAYDKWYRGRKDRKDEESLASLEERRVRKSIENNEQSWESASGNEILYFIT